ncbi:L,D-transpeptidase family protein [Novosphingobium sp. BL-8A]|uniref:L,D-transpeptidase family protein n=1 Tax=Novosphingobium sp. BL-8A TaxID=3127639 RepID=UPI003757106E
MRRGLQLAPLLLLLGIGTVDAQPSLPPSALPPVDLIRVLKSERRMELWSGGRIVHVIDHIQLGDRPDGPKHFEGDERTPEGRYAIDWGNPNSAYHLSLHISYPDPADTAYAAERGRSPGGMIMIHGQPNGMAGRAVGDWTDGCIAVSNAEIELLWAAVGDGTPIEIQP